MNVSANIIIGANHFIPPGWDGWTLNISNLLLVFGFARFSDSSYSSD
jgi:hypothetical protein